MDESIQSYLPRTETEDAPTRTLKLSEAIRIGARVVPQNCAGGFERNGAYCAMATAAYTRGWRPLCGESVYSFIPECDDPSVGGRIAHMNDRQRMTREAIADWLESQGL